MAPKKTYQVGYGHPPKGSQFQKGVSGNPRGRPKGSLNVASVLERTSRELITININGKRKQITKLEAAAMQVSNKSASSLVGHPMLICWRLAWLQQISIG